MDCLAEIPLVVTEFIEKYIESVDVLEILLWLRKTPENAWGASAVSKALALDNAVVAARLNELESLGLLRQRTVENDRLYQYGPAAQEVISAIDELAKVYSTFRVSIVGLIFSKPLKDIHTFPDS